MPTESILIEAIKSKCSQQTVLSILAEGVDVNFRDNKGLTALAYAIKDGRNEILEFLINAGADVNVKNKEGDNFILTSAIKKGAARIVKILLKAGADIHAKNKDGDTALIHAVTEDLSITKLIIEAGAMINDKNNKGTTALMKAAGFAPVPTIIFFYHGLNPRSHLQIIDSLIKAGAEIEEKDDKGETALMYAAKSGRTETIESLTVTSNLLFIKHYKSRADINAVNHKGYTALMLAIESSYYNNFKYLLKLGADVNVKSKDGKTSLKLAKSKWVWKNSYIKPLVDAGARH